MNEKIRLDKYISSQLGLSRTDAKKTIKSGAVTVNGKSVKNGDMPVDPENDTVSCGGSTIGYKKHVYLMLNKPKGVVSASSSPGDKTVVDLVPEKMKRKGLFPAGRLDKDSTGFVLITDDGEFAHFVLSPAHHIPKTYLVTAVSPLSDSEMTLFKNGVGLSDGVTKPAEISFEKFDGEDRAVYRVTLTEGRYHQIKRMFSALGSGVGELFRIRFGGLELDPDLCEGECRELTSDEVLRITE